MIKQLSWVRLVFPGNQSIKTFIIFHLKILSKCNHMHINNTKYSMSCIYIMHMYLCNHDKRKGSSQFKEWGHRQSWREKGKQRSKVIIFQLKF